MPLTCANPWFDLDLDIIVSSRVVYISLKAWQLSRPLLEPWHEASKSLTQYSAVASRSNHIMSLPILFKKIKISTEIRLIKLFVLDTTAEYCVRDSMLHAMVLTIAAIDSEKISTSWSITNTTMERYISFGASLPCHSYEVRYPPSGDRCGRLAEFEKVFLKPFLHHLHHGWKTYGKGYA